MRRVFVWLYKIFSLTVDFSCKQINTYQWSVTSRSGEGQSDTFLVCSVLDRAVRM